MKSYETRRALYIGRFQPFHKGHFEIVQHILSQEDVDELIIGIGSAQYGPYSKSKTAPRILNPFSFEERKLIIESSLENRVSKPYQVLPVNDLHNFPKWVDYVLESLPGFKYFYTNQKEEIWRFEKKHVITRRTPIVYSDFSATHVRKQLFKGEGWEKYLLPEAAAYLKSINAEKRIRDLASLSALDDDNKNGDVF